MSILANITVYKCDGCGQIATVQTEEDDASFLGNWYAGMLIDYCPTCRVEPENQEAIDIEKDAVRKTAMRSSDIELYGREGVANGH